MIKVLIVDDSAVIRQGLSEILSKFDDIQVIGTAVDPYAAASKMRNLAPDLIILDIEMPKMDGITFLKKLMSQHPIPVIICSSLVGSNTQSQIKALEYGAIDIILKPKTGTRQFLQESAVRIAQTVRAAAQAKVTKLQIGAERKARPKLDTDAMLPSKTQTAMLKTTEKVLVVGASTGGTEVIRRLLQDMPADCPPIAIVQHMPEGFTRSFSQRLNQLCAINVKEAENGDSLLRGHALIAPGNKHMLIERSGARYYVAIKDGPLICRHRPSVNVLFRSAAQVLGRNGIGAILTGMGDDGATGMLEMKNAGASTIGQDESSCVVYGMPKEALKLGALQHQISIDKMAKTILHLSLD